MLEDFALLLVDDHPLFRDGLMAALRHQAPELRVCAVGTLAEALDALALSDDVFDLVLLDYRLPGMDGLRCAQLLMQKHPGVAVGLMSGLDDPNLPGRAREAGLSAYFPKSMEIASLLKHLEQLARGELVFSTSGQAPLTSDVDSGPDRMGLTARQQDVLRALARGSSKKEIARAMGISPATVKKHLEAVFVKLGATNRVQAVLRARALLGELPS